MPVQFRKASRCQMMDRLLAKKQVTIGSITPTAINNSETGMSRPYSWDYG